MLGQVDSERFDLNEAVAVLERTPRVLTAMLEGMPAVLVRATEGEGTWSPYDVVGHLIHGERTDWIVRTRHILSGENRPFDPFDRTAQFAARGERTLDDLLEEFAGLRQVNLRTLEELRLTDADLERRGVHPDLGIVTLGQLLATWVVHDLDHIGQVARTMAKRHTKNVGPWSAYLSILGDRR